MDRKLHTLLPLIPAALVLAAVSLPQGCANTTQAPSGGPRDTIPPHIVNISPLPGTVNVDRRKAQVIFTFDEYVKVKDAKSVYLSPPLSKAPRTRIRGKSLVVSFDGDLDSATTYTLDITGAVVDNNEGNPFAGYTLVFSTGPAIDSMVVTGIVQDCNTLQPVKGATVMLYKDPADSAVFLHRPDAAVKTDDWGFFCLRNIQDTVYRVYAIQDSNNDNLYQADGERIAFLDSAFRPTTVVSDTLPELYKYDMKDTALCMARRTELELNLFREHPSKQFIVKKERVGDRTAYVTFMAPGAAVHRMRIKGLPQEKLITQFNPTRDSLEIWVNDQRRLPDTLHFLINYDKTDTLGRLVPTDEDVKLALDRKARAAAQKSSQRDLRHEDTVCVYTGEVAPETVEQYGFVLEFKYPLIQDAFDGLTFRSVNPRQKETVGRYRVIPDTTNLRRFTIMPEEELQQGWDYYLKVPHRRFRDINGHWNDSTELKVTLPNDDRLSTLQAVMTGVRTRYIVDLLNEKRDKVLRSFIIDRDGTLTFPYIKAGSYALRITEDVNRNGLVDTGSLIEHRQPEKVKFYKLQDSFILRIPERAELVQEIDLEALFR